MDLEDMNILRPQITRIGNRYYRKLVFEEGDSNGNTVSNNVISDEEEYEDNDNDCESIEKSSNGFKSIVNVPVELVKFVCGKKMETKTRIEKETNTQIKIPRIGAEDPLVITGAKKNDVSSCRRKIEIIIETSRQKIPPTHFISFPLYNKDIIGRLVEFKNMALKMCKQSKGLESNIFQKPEKLHLTVVMLTLLTKNEVENAIFTLENCFKEVIKPLLADKPIRITLEGVEYMNDDPNKVDVLYAKVNEMDEGERLQRLANEIMKYFVTKNLAKDEFDSVKLHATVINTKMREMKSLAKSGTRGQSVNRVSFDATQITENFKDFYFGEHHVDNIHLCQRGVYEENGQYHCCKSLALT